MLVKICVLFCQILIKFDGRIFSLFFCSKTILCRYYSVFLESVYYLRLIFLYFWCNYMENAPPPQIMENAQPPRKFDFWDFPSNCAYNNTGLFFDFFALYYRVLYLLLWLCFFWPLENVSIIGAIWPKIKKNTLFGRETFKIFLQIATIIQASFLTFFVIMAYIYMFWFFYTLGKRLHYSRNLTDNFKNYSFWGWNFWNFCQIWTVIQASFLTFVAT